MDPGQLEAKILIAHSGELSDVECLAGDIGALTSAVSNLQATSIGPNCRVVIGTPRNLLERSYDPGEPENRRPTFIAVVDNDSKTLRSRLRRAQIDYIVRRPVHPAALRLLLLHTLYSGPERRLEERMSVGVPVRFRTGLWRQAAVLTDLSMRGCGLLTHESVEVGRRLKVYLPSPLGVGRTLRVNGRVVRSVSASPRDEARARIAIHFAVLPASAEKRLRNAVMIHACGPARLPGPPVGVASQPAAAEEASATAVEATAPPRPVGPADTADTADVEDRRCEPRRGFEKRVVALGKDSSGVLLGRDLSGGGMRVTTDLGLEVGDLLRIALPLDASAAPLVLEARVNRTDGDGGMGLEFVNLSESAGEQLKQVLSYLPIGSADPDGDYASLVVSEILNREVGSSAEG